MRDLDAYDDILAHTAEPGLPNIRGFRYVFGAEGHKEIFTVPSVFSCSNRVTHGMHDADASNP